MRNITRVIRCVLERIRGCQYEMCDYTTMLCIYPYPNHYQFYNFLYLNDMFAIDC